MKQKKWGRIQSCRSVLLCLLNILEVVYDTIVLKYDLIFKEVLL